MIKKRWEDWHPGFMVLMVIVAFVSFIASSFGLIALVGWMMGLSW